MSGSRMHPTYTLDVDAHTLILQEVQTLSAFIRRSPRWAAAPQSAYSATYYSVVVGPKLAAASAVQNDDPAATKTHSRTSSLVVQKAQQQSQPLIANATASLSAPKRTHVSIVRDESVPGSSRPSSALGMRKSTGSGSGSGVIGSIESEEMDLLAGFVGLKRSLAQVNDFTEVPPIDIIRPFLDLIRSPLTSGPITSLALTSLNTLILHILPCYQPFPLPPLTSESFTIASPPTPLQIALTQITSTIARCRFPSTNPAQDEVVLLRLLKATESLVTGPLERDLNDEGVCEILEVGLGMAGRARLGEGLRRTAQSAVGAIVKAGFGRLKLMDPEIVLGEKSQISSLQAEEKTIGTGGGDAAISESEVSVSANENSDKQGSRADGEQIPVERSASQSNGTRLTESSASAINAVAIPPFTPYGLPTLLELLRVLISLLNPQDLTHTDSMRLSALGVLNAALEAGGRHIGNWSELVDGLKDEGCRYLFQLIRSENHQVLTLALRTCGTLFTTLLPQLKLQLELFLTFLMDRLTPTTLPSLPAHLLQIRGGANSSGRLRNRDSDRGTTVSSGPAEGGAGDRPSTPKLPATPTASASLASSAPITSAETRELMLETLTQLLQMRNEHFMVDLWVNYDCDVDSEDVFERMIAFLTQGVYGNAASTAQSGPNSIEGLDNSQMLCFEAVLDFIEGISTRLGENTSSREWPANAPSIERLRRQKDRKALLITGAQAFNTKPKKGVAYLREHSLIDGYKPDGDEAENIKALAVFLRSNGRLDKKLLGEYISNPDNLDLLKAYIGLFDFKGKSIADAMRELLEAFRLPGESQPIARITEVFAEHYISFKPAEIKDADAAYVLAYSVIMLNTDQHNPQNRRRMAIEDYQRNLRGVNGGEDFAPEYLAAIHDSIRKNEIIMPQEHVGQAGFDYAWKGLIQRSRAAGKTITTDIGAFDKEIFKLSWHSVVEAIASAFSTGAQDEYVIQRAIKGFRQCATLGREFDLPEVIDNIVLSLSYATGLLDDTDDGYQSTNHPVVNSENGEITVSPLSVRFGNSFRGQLATVVLFTIAHGNGDAIREGWSQIFEMFQTLFIHSLLPAKLSQEVEFLSGNSAIPLKLNNPTPIREERRSETGLLSTLSSYLLSPYGNSETVVTPSEDDVEYTLSALDCLASCKLEEFYQDLHQLSQESLLAALRSLRSLAESRSGPKHKDYASLRVREENTGRAATPAYDETQQPYDPATVLDLELMVELASSKPEYAAETWPIVFDFIAALLTSAQLYSVLLIERAVTGLLRLCLLICEQPNLRDQLYIALDALRSLPASALNAVSEQLMSGIAKILEKERTVVKSQTEWGLITALFRATVAHPEASKVTLELVRKTTSGAVGSGLTADNYQGMVAILDEFATAAGAATMRVHHQRRGTSQPVAATLGPIVERGLAALDSLYELRNVIPDLMKASSLTKVDAWNTFWLPPLMAVAKHCVNGSRDIRQKAVSYLQRLLLSQQLMSSEEAALSAVFARVLLPILDELLKPQVFDRDPAGMEETRLRAATLLCKVFLQYLMLLGETKETIATLLTRVIDLLERFMRTGSRQLYEAVPESLKNVLLVMQSSGFLAPPITPDIRTDKQKLLWTTAYNRIERFLPGFLNEVIPAPSAPKEIVSVPKLSKEQNASSEEAKPAQE